MKFLILSLLFSFAYGLCPDTVTCINRVREVVAAPKRFWFGEQRRAQCNHRNSNPIDCFGPSQLSSFHSLGSRLFRVRTYHSAYLRNLNIFPRVTYRAAPGVYRACEHDFLPSNNSSPIEVDPDMMPVSPFAIRHRPEIDWQNLQYDEEYTIVITDVGFGTLNYLATHFPKKTTVLKEYEPSDNFRALSNPLVILVFKKNNRTITLTETEDFNLSQFMMLNELEDNLVGMNIVVVGSDAFAIERQRILGNVDNCHSLLFPKLHRTPPSKIIASLPLNEISQWISVQYTTDSLDVNVCCQRVKQSPTSIFLDPIGDLSISALSTLTPPTFTSLPNPTAHSTYMNYHRHTRTFVALMDETFSLVLIDGTTGKLHWMIVDIPSVQLRTEGDKGITKASYHPLTPADPASCRKYIFALFQQTSSLKKHKNYCEGDCPARKDFRIESFKQRHGLRLVALNWVSSCYDLPYAFHLLSNVHDNTTAFNKKSRLHYPDSTEVCTAFKVSPYHKCRVYSNVSANFSSLYLILTILPVIITTMINL